MLRAPEAWAGAASHAIGSKGSTGSHWPCMWFVYAQASDRSGQCSREHVRQSLKLKHLEGKEISPTAADDHCVYMSVFLNRGWFSPPWNIWQCLTSVLVTTVGRVLSTVMTIG